MTTAARAKELALVVRPLTTWRNVTDLEADEIANLLESHARILEAALPDNVSVVAHRHEQTEKWGNASVQSHADRATLLDAARVLTAERDSLAELVNKTCDESLADVKQAVAQRDAARAEVERWKSRDEIVTHHEHELVKERDDLKQRADALAEGVRAHREYGRQYIPSMESTYAKDTWERGHGHLVGDSK